MRFRAQKFTPAEITILELTWGVVLLPMAPPLATLPSQGADIGSLGIGPGIECKLLSCFRLLIFQFPAPLNYQGADIRTEGFRSKPISAPKGLGRGPNANY